MLFGQGAESWQKGHRGLGALDVAHVFMHSCSVGGFLGGCKAFAAIVFGAGDAKDTDGEDWLAPLVQVQILGAKCFGLAKRCPNTDR